MNPFLHFEPSHAEALRRVDAIDPAAYARSRNALDGAVTGLSPYLTHGIVTLPEVMARLLQRSRIGWDDKLLFEFGWREFFLHVWSHAGSAVLADLRPTPTWPGRYADRLPDDIRRGATGVPAIDAAVRQLYATGYLHNHARMWLASYVVHLRKLHWSAGADWMLAHLLDGDIPSNHLSWQWVAGTFSSKPYLFNAENVARYAPREGRGAWLSPGTAIDRSYEALDALARRNADVGAEPGRHAAVDEPVLRAGPPADIALPAFDASRWQAAEHIVLRHPWDLAEKRGSALHVGVLHLPAHAPRPWSERRWRWVLSRMAAVCDMVFVGDLGTLDRPRAATATAAPWPVMDAALARLATLQPAPRLMSNPLRLQRSFSAFYAEARRHGAATMPLFAGDTA